ncbi:MAG: hydantoinase/oxoprolinase family protein [Salinirussus sp.]
MSVRLGVDIGGTFTDVVLYDPATGEFEATKTPSTPGAFEHGVIDGIEAILEQTETEPGAVSFLGHATTVATNAVLENDLPPVGLLTTAGFRDVLEIGKQTRPDPFDLQTDKPPVLVPRDRRLEVPGRISADGEEIEPLDEAAAEAAIDDLEALDIESVVVSTLFSYLNDAHEVRLGELLAERDLDYALSSAVHPERREYERTVTTVINESAKQVVADYLDRVDAAIDNLGIAVATSVMHCGGGSFSLAEAATNAVRTIGSGPAAGAIATVGQSNREGFDNAIGLDMGGTSADISIVRDGEAIRSTENEINNLPLEIPMVDIETVGAGGGSIARIDAGGALRVGPASAGANPGPVCYGRGGDQPTITDANLVLGRISPTRPIGGEITPDLEQARTVLEDTIADPLGQSITQTALDILDVATARLVRNVRKVTIERGLDPAGFALVAFGGMGPQVATSLADELDIDSVVVPPQPGMFSARGLLSADVRVQESHAYTRETIDPETTVSDFDDLAATVIDRLTDQGFDQSEINLEFAMDMRYAGQAYELTVPVATDSATTSAVDKAAATFHDHHEERYGYAIRDNEVKCATLRVTGHVPRSTDIEGFDAADGPARLGARDVHFNDRGAVEAAVYERSCLAPGRTLDGPAIVEEEGSTTVIPPDRSAQISKDGAITIEP